jgi:short-subunit dehydrogenase
MQLTRYVLPSMIEQGHGRIVNIGSMFGSIGFPCFAAYSASKFAMRGFSQALRRELTGTGVGVTYVSPRAVKTRFNPPVVHRMAELGMMRMDDPQWVARKIVQAIEKEKDEAYLGFPESLFARINAVLPRIVDGAIVKQVPTLVSFTAQGRKAT